MRIALGNIFSWLVTALFGVITLLLAFESWALLTNHRPISDYVRSAVHSYPGWAFVIAVVVRASCWVTSCGARLTAGRPQPTKPDELQPRGDPVADRDRRRADCFPS